MIEVKELTKNYGSTQALCGISFTLEPGYIYGFLGPNGAGKSTTMNIITGCLPANEGSVKINSLDIYTDAIKVKRRLGYLPEIPPLYPELTVFEFLTFVANAKGIKGDAAIDEVKRVMTATDISDKAAKLCSHLSKGYKQRVGIAQAIIGDPDFIVLDEPSAGLDPEQIVAMRDLILSLASEDRTIILSSHILSEIAEICDHLLIINRGRIIATDTMQNLRERYLSGRNNASTVKIKGALPGLRESIEALSGVISCEWSEEASSDETLLVGRIEYPIDADIRGDLFKLILSYGGSVVEITTETPSLEQVYMDIIEEDNSKAADTIGENNQIGENENKKEEATVQDPEENKSDYTPLFSKKEDDE